MKLERGLVQVYTGDGKGKTTAAFGQALRALGHGLRVFVVQYLKGEWDIGERTALKCFGDSAGLRYFGSEYRRPKGGGPELKDVPWWLRPVSEEDKQVGQAAFACSREVVMSGEWDVVVLDEVHSAVAMGLVPVEDLLALMRDKPKHVELVTTGQRAHEKVIDAADLVTEMRLVKHPFQQNILAREGIEY